MVAVPHARLYIRQLQVLTVPCQIAKAPLTEVIQLTALARGDLVFWAHLTSDQGWLPIQADPPLHTIFTDASYEGWGAVYRSHMGHGEWEVQQYSWDINMLELKTVHLALKSFLPFLQGQSVLICTDNMATYFYLKKQGGTGALKTLLPLAIECWEFALNNNIEIHAQHVPGQWLNKSFIIIT